MIIRIFLKKIYDSLCIWGMAQVELDVAPRPLSSKPLQIVRFELPPTAGQSKPNGMKWPFSIIQMENLHKQPRKWCLPSGERKVKAKLLVRVISIALSAWKFATKIKQSTK